ECCTHAHCSQGCRPCC
uniref:Conotoxin ar3g n=1 Tax=Conus araneosus TaxID=101286 RepID=CM3G_CONAO|nr:RecName: Full=Conotoxin ar3g; AltName: Full=Conotoxin ar3h [Conus araneosus]